MFQQLFRRAQASVELTIEHAMLRAVMVVPFLIAAGFGAAALSYRLNADFGPEAGNLIMAGVFVVVGLVIVGVMALRAPAAASPAVGDSKPADVPHLASDVSATRINDTDHELIAAALASVAPMVLPQIMRLVVKNLPLLAAVGATLFLVSRPSQVTPAFNNGDPGVEPAEQPLRAAA